MTEPLVSIIVPVWNQEKLVIRALDSIPVRGDVEILIYDDGSTDGTRAAVNEWCEKRHEAFPEQHVFFYMCDENMGLGHAKNVLIDFAKGTYIHELDSDDYLYTDRYIKVFDHLDGTDVVCIDLITNDGTRFALGPDSKRSLCGGPCHFYRREFIGDTRCPEIRAAEDFEFNNAILDKNPTEYFTHIAAYHYNFPREGSLYNLMIRGLPLH